VAAIAKKLCRNEHFQTIVGILLIVAVVFGFWYGSQAVLNTSIPPALAVVSGSMDTISNGETSGWAHPFSRTLQVGDLIIIKGVNPHELNTDYPNSDIIVFHRPDNPRELIVHRIVSSTTIDDKLHFFTKGDGNRPVIWPESQEGMYDKWVNNNASIPIGAVSQDFVEGKVIMRIPIIGYLPMLVQSIISNNAAVVLPIMVLIILIIVLVGFVYPTLKQRGSNSAPFNDNSVENLNLT
jgi:hypothetical protein